MFKLSDYKKIKDAIRIVLRVFSETNLINVHEIYTFKGFSVLAENKQLHQLHNTNKYNFHNSVAPSFPKHNKYFLNNHTLYCFIK